MLTLKIFNKETSDGEITKSEFSSYKIFVSSTLQQQFLSIYI